MKRLSSYLAAAGILTAACAGSTGLAGAATVAATVATTGSNSAADVIAELRAEGYDVQINGSPDAPLSECTVTGIHGLSDSNTDSAGHRIDPHKFSTVYVDVTGPSDA